MNKQNKDATAVANDVKLKLGKAIPVEIFDVTGYLDLLQLGRPKIKHAYSTLFITGASGLGKSWLAHQLAGKMQANLINLDKFGSVKNDKWIVDWSQVKKRLLMSGMNFIEGTCDNMSEAEKYLGPITSLIIPVPSLKSFSTIQTAKADGYMKKGKPENHPWVLGWREKARFSPSQLVKFLVAKAVLISGFTKPSSIILITTPEIEQEVEGWFGS
jgi:hypothetical protein